MLKGFTLAFLYNTPELCLFSSIFFLCDILIGLLLFFPLFDRTLTVSWNTSIYMNVFSNRSLYSGWKVTSGVCFYLKHSWCFEYQVLKICPNFFFPGQDVCLKMTGWVFCSKSSLLSISKYQFGCLHFESTLLLLKSGHKIVLCYIWYSCVLYY